MRVPRLNTLCCGLHPYATEHPLMPRTTEKVLIVYSWGSRRINILVRVPNVPCRVIHP